MVNHLNRKEEIIASVGNSGEISKCDWSDNIAEKIFLKLNSVKSDRIICALPVNHITYDNPDQTFPNVLFMELIQIDANGKTTTEHMDKGADGAKNQILKKAGFDGPVEYLPRTPTGHKSVLWISLCVISNEGCNGWPKYNYKILYKYDII